MENQLFKNLKSLKKLAPDQEFLNRSRRTILAIEKPASSSRFYAFQLKHRLRESLIFTVALGLASLMLYVATTGLNNTGQPALTQESKPDLNIQLIKAKYYKEIAPNVYVVVLDDEQDE